MKDEDKWHRDFATRGKVFELKGIRDSDLVKMDEAEKEDLLEKLLSRAELDGGYVRSPIMVMAA